MTNIIKQKSYTIKEELNIIELVKSGVPIAKLKREWGIPEGTMRGWFRKEEKLQSFLDKLNNSCRLERKKSRPGKNVTVDDCLYTWYIEKHSLDFPLTGLTLKMQAEIFFKDFQLEGEFVATNG